MILIPDKFTQNKLRLTFWQIWNVSFGFLEIKIGFGLRQANMSPIYKYSGAVETAGNYEEITPNIDAPMPPDDDKHREKAQTTNALPILSLDADGFRIFNRKQ